jgi:hypothetical protein
VAREGDGGAPTLTGCQEVRSPFRSQRGLVGRMGGKTPRKGLEMATLAKTCYACPNGVTPVLICSYGQSRGPRESREKQMQGDILQ